MRNECAAVFPESRNIFITSAFSAVASSVSQPGSSSARVPSLSVTAGAITANARSIISAIKPPRRKHHNCRRNGWLSPSLRLWRRFSLAGFIKIQEEQKEHDGSTAQMFIDTMKEKKKKKDRLIINISPHWLSDSKVKRWRGQRRRLLVVFGHGEDKVLPAGAEGAAGRQAAPPPIRPTPGRVRLLPGARGSAHPLSSADSAVGSAAAPDIPGNPPRDAALGCSSTRPGWPPSSSAEEMEKKTKILTFLFFLKKNSSSNVQFGSPCELMFGSLFSFFDMMRCEKASCWRMLQHLQSCYRQTVLPLGLSEESSER